jgi:multidrug resistance efflux pump
LASVTNELERLAQLLDRGLLTREEFDEQKASLLAQSRRDSGPPG